MPKLWSLDKFKSKKSRSRPDSTSSDQGGSADVSKQVALSSERPQSEAPGLGQSSAAVPAFISQADPAPSSKDSVTEPIASNVAGNTATTSGEEVIVNCCRACSDRYEYTWKGWTTKIIVGIPRISDYVAVSYVWGNYSDLPLRCLKCQKRTTFPMESLRKFQFLMGPTAAPSGNIWLDALSIDQSNPKDKAAQIAEMGNIYSNASAVLVFLPKADEEAFQLLVRITTLADNICRRNSEFKRNNSDQGDEELSKACQEFYKLVDEFEQNIHKWLYWRRAWTFQEWTLARDISLTWEGYSEQRIMNHMKIVILQAATLMAIYKLQGGSYAGINLGFPRGQVAKRFDAIKRLFPCEPAFIPPDMIDEKEVQFNAMMPSMRLNSILGLRSSSEFSMEPSPPIREIFSLHNPIPPLNAERQKERLSMVLNALGSSKRESRHEADLISSWASMCNIKYSYDQHDPFEIALQKVLRALRGQCGLTIHNFLANTQGSSGEVDLKFLEYACAHKQCNSAVDGILHGTPVFTGRTDTIVHLRTAISQSKTKTPLAGSGIKLRRVKNSKISTAACMTDTRLVLGLFYPAICGSIGMGIMFNDVLDNVEGVLKTAPREQLEQYNFILVQISFKTPGSGTHPLSAWAICHKDIELSKCFIAREGLNGTLVIAMPSKKAFEVVAYLTVTDQQSGTHLIMVDENGRVDMKFLTPISPDRIDGSILDNREFQGAMELERGSVMAF